MINPLVDNLDNLTDAEIDEKLQDLQRKYFMTQNHQVRTQMQNILEIYKLEKQSRAAKQAQKDKDAYDNDNDIDGLININ